MRNYFKNILRAISKNLSSYIGVISIVSLAILIFVCMFDVLFNLKTQANTYFNECNFADVFATVNQMPSNKLNTLENIEGVDIAFGRLSSDIRLLTEDSTKIVSVHVLAYSKSDSLNLLNISTDDTPITNAIYIGSKMAATYGFKAGDPIDVIVHSDIKTLTYQGTVQSPEYIYIVPPTGIRTPDSAIYDVACMSVEDVENLFNKKGIINEIGIKLKPGYTFQDVESQLEQHLNDYGLISLIARKDQFSYNMLFSEFNLISSLAIALPAIFLLVSTFMLYIILKKMINQDRSLIGTMKAFGFDNSNLIIVYMKQGVVIGALGGVFGSLLAIPLGKALFLVYTKILNLPSDQYKISIYIRLIGCFLALTISIASTYLGIKDILKISPAESMRSATPNIKSKLTIPTWLNTKLNFKYKMSLRSLLRYKFRNFVIAFSISFPFAFTSSLLCVAAGTEAVYYSQFSKVQTYDLKVSLSNYTSHNAVCSAGKQLDNVYDIESIGEFSINLKHENLSKYVSLLALNPGSNLYKIMDIHNTYYEPYDNGLIIGAATAAKLNLKEGDIVQMYHPKLNSQSVSIPIMKIIQEGIGNNCYISMNALVKYFNTNKLANTILLKAFPNKLDAIKSALSQTTEVTSITDAEQAMNGYKASMASLNALVKAFTILSLITGIVLIYNILNITLRERKIEFGTLAILGTTYNEQKKIIYLEQIINFVIGILLGFPLSMLFLKVLQACITSENFVVNLHMETSYYIYSFFICLITIGISLTISLQNVKNILLTDILKERE